jgi:short subunit dehydrogenase-like uncharacterized protein
VKDEREFDIILWGATSFVGKLISRHLFHRHGIDGDLRWALAARNPARVETLQQSLGEEALSLPVLIGDAFDTEFLREMAARTRVVLSTVGPYLTYGEPLVAACAAGGTDYCDLTGEVPFAQRMMDRYGADAEASGARIIHCTGVDSLPSDLGVAFLNDFAVRECGAPLQSVEMHVRAFRGGFSGGTLASFLEVTALAQKDPGVTRMLRNPYALCPPDQRTGVRQPELDMLGRSEVDGRWLHPFFMAPVNTRVVHATNARLGYPYGQDFTYTERQAAPNQLAATVRHLVMAGLMLGMSNGAGRSLLARYLFPKPGEGPNESVRNSGYFKFVFHGRTRNDRRVTGQVTGDADPGYGSTAKQIAEAAFHLAREVPRTRVAGGFWTPVSALGLGLVDPLVAHAGLRFEAKHAD